MLHCRRHCLVLYLALYTEHARLRRTAVVCAGCGQGRWLLFPFFLSYNDPTLPRSTVFIVFSFSYIFPLSSVVPRSTLTLEERSQLSIFRLLFTQRKSQCHNSTANYSKCISHLICTAVVTEQKNRNSIMLVISTIPLLVPHRSALIYLHVTVNLEYYGYFKEITSVWGGGPKLRFERLCTYVKHLTTKAHFAESNGILIRASWKHGLESYTVLWNHLLVHPVYVTWFTQLCEYLWL